jgi:hypothetical protein
MNQMSATNMVAYVDGPEKRVCAQVSSPGTLRPLRSSCSTLCCWAFSIEKLEIQELESILYDIFDAAVRVTDGRTSA